MIVRVLQESDAKSYQEVRLSGLRNDPDAFGSTFEREKEFSLETVISRISPTQDKFVLGAFVEGELVGIVAFVREVGMKIAHKGNIFGMYVAPEMRGTGVGRELLLELIKKAKDMEDLEQINLTVISGNSNAKKLYASLGFEIYGTERNAIKYKGQYFDEDLMALKL